MINTITRTFEILGNDKVNRVECTVYYSKGGVNYFFGTTEQRGYYFSINPYQLVDHGNGLFSKMTVISPTAGTSGEKTCILPVTRQSKKRYGEAKAQLDELIGRFLEPFCAKRGLVLGNLIGEKETER